MFYKRICEGLVLHFRLLFAKNNCVLKAKEQGVSGGRKQLVYHRLLGLITVNTRGDLTLSIVDMRLICLDVFDILISVRAPGHIFTQVISIFSYTPCRFFIKMWKWERERLRHSHKKVEVKNTVLEVLLAFQFFSFVYLSAPQITPRENVSAGQEAQSTQKDDYAGLNYLCLPLTHLSVLSPRILELLGGSKGAWIYLHSLGNQQVQRKLSSGINYTGKTTKASGEPQVLWLKNDLLKKDLISPTGTRWPQGRWPWLSGQIVRVLDLRSQNTPSVPVDLLE